MLDLQCGFHKNEEEFFASAQLDLYYYLIGEMSEEDREGSRRNLVISVERSFLGLTQLPEGHQPLMKAKGDD